MDEVGLYNRALSAAEIQAIYAAGAFGKCQGPAPSSVTVTPSSLDACQGDAATFTASVTGSGTLTYQWCKNGVSINGATASTYTRLSPSAADAGTYKVTVYDSLGQTTSAGATLAVHPHPKATLNIAGSTTAPPSTTIPPGGAVDIEVLLTGTGPWNLVWSDGTTENGVADNPHTYTVNPTSTKTYKLMGLSDQYCAALSGDLAGTVVVNVEGASIELPPHAIGQQLSGSLTNVSFGGDMFFYVESQVDLYGTTTIEGGTVVLFSSDPAAKIIIHDPSIICDTGPYRTATFMSEDLLNYAYYFADPSTPAPSGFYGQGLALALENNSPVVLKGLQFFNLGSGVSFEGTGSYSCTLYDCQFIDCSNALAQTDSAASVNVFNALFCDATNVFALDPAVTSPQVNLQHVTVDGCQSLVSGLPGSGSWRGKKSLFVNVQDQGSIPTALRNSSTCRTLSASSGIFLTGG